MTLSTERAAAYRAYRRSPGFIPAIGSAASVLDVLEEMVGAECAHQKCHQPAGECDQVTVTGLFEAAAELARRIEAGELR